MISMCLRFLVIFFFSLLQFAGIMAASNSPIEDSLNFRGQSRIQHYTKKDFLIDVQFWSMAEDKNGVLYFGHNKGIAIYDGNSWSQLTLPNGSSVKSVKRSFDDRIFVGGSNEFGTVEQDSYGNYFYKSLIGLLNVNDQKIEEVWQILSFDDKILIRSFRNLIILDNNKVKILSTETSFNYVNYIDKYVYVIDDVGISRLDPNTLELNLLFKSQQFNKERIIALLPTPINYELIGFSKKGKSYIFNLKTTSTKLDKVLFLPDTEDQIFCAIQYSKNEYLLGTINEQILSYQYNKKIVQPWRSDLQNPTVLGMQKSSDGNIWVLLNKGIDCIETSFPGSIIFDGASVYDAILHEGFLYIATNQGVYASRLDQSGQLTSSKFKIIRNLAGQAWTLSIHDGQLFVGHDRGAYTINGLFSKHISGSDGIWKVIEIKGRPDVLMACAYNGIYILELRNGEYQIKNKVENFDTSPRDILQTEEPGVFWVCHGYEGVYNIKINNEFTRVIAKEHFTDKNGLPSQYNINVTKYEDEIVFLSKYGFYKFDELANKFVEKEGLNQSFQNNLNVSKLIKHEDRTWFVQDEELGYFDKSDKLNLHKRLFSSLNGTFITSLEYLNVLSNDRILAGTNEGLFHFDLSAKESKKEVPSIINRISYKTNKDSTIFANIKDSKREIQLPHNINSLTFYFSAPGLTPKKDIQFSYQLEKFDKNWSNWSKITFREFSFLNHGKYVFKVKAKSVIGMESNEAIYNITILPVWYQTKIALFIFFILALFISFVIYKMVIHRLEQTRIEEAKLRHALELEVDAVNLQKEKELVEKDNEKLADDIINKSKEIANYTLLLVKKHDLLNEIGTEVNEIKKSAKLDKTKNSLRSIAQKIRMNLQDEEHLKIFDTNFERVHQDFFKRIRKRFPDLQQKELRMCGLIKMNMTNKEIASILNISVRGTETAKYRLRKHLTLDNDVNLLKFLADFSNQDEESNIE